MLVNTKFLCIVVSMFLLLAECSTVKGEGDKQQRDKKERLKRESILSSPIYYDPMPHQAIQPTVTPPVQQQQGLPILGALVSSVPGLNGIASTLTTLVPLGNLGNLGNLGGLGNLGALGNLGGLGNLGALGNLGNLGGLTNGVLGNLGGMGNLPGLGNLGGLLPGTVPRCSLGQTLNCRCENLLPLPVQSPPTRSSSDGLEILQQNIKFNLNGDKETSARLSNGLLFYQRSGIEKLANNKSSKVFQGFYTFKIKDNKYLTIYYTINDLDYTVKADVTAEPPQNDLDTLTATAKFEQVK